jgi:hypothetical protein
MEGDDQELKGDNSPILNTFPKEDRVSAEEVELTAGLDTMRIPEKPNREVLQMNPFNWCFSRNYTLKQSLTCPALTGDRLRLKDVLALKIPGKQSRESTDSRTHRPAREDQYYSSAYLFFSQTPVFFERPLYSSP